MFCCDVDLIMGLRILDVFIIVVVVDFGLVGSFFDIIFLGFFNDDLGGWVEFVLVGVGDGVVVIVDFVVVLVFICFDGDGDCFGGDVNWCLVLRLKCFGISIIFCMCFI